MQKYQTKFHVSFSFEFFNCLAFHSTLYFSKMARNFLFYCQAHKHRKLICKLLCSNILVLNTTSIIRYNFELILCEFVIDKKFSKITHSCKEMALVIWVSLNTYTLKLPIYYCFLYLDTTFWQLFFILAYELSKNPHLKLHTFQVDFLYQAFSSSNFSWINSRFWNRSYKVSLLASNTTGSTSFTALFSSPLKLKIAVGSSFRLTLSPWSLPIKE